MAQTTPTPNKELLSVNEAAAYLKVASKTLYRWEQAGKLVPQRTSGGHRRYLLVDLQHFVANQSAEKKTRVTSTQPVPTHTLVPHVAVAPVAKQPKSKKALDDQRRLTKEEIRELYEGMPKANKHILGGSLVAALGIVGLLALGIGKLLPGTVSARLAGTTKSMLANVGNFVETYSPGLALFSRASELEQARKANSAQLAKVLADTSSLESMLLEINIDTNLSGSTTFQGTAQFDGDVTANGDVDLAGTTNVTGDLQLAGTTLTSTATELNYLDGITLGSGEIVYTDGTSLVTLDAGSSGQLLKSNGTDAPSWITSTDIDAGKVDGIDSGSFLRSDSSDTYSSGTLTFSSGTILDLDSATVKATTTTLNAVAYTWPSSDGTANYVLATDGSGALSWVASSAVAGGLWTQASGVLYPTTTTDDLAIGGTTLAASIFSIDESAGVFLFGGDQSADPILRFEATDSDTGDFGFNTNDAFYFTGGNIGVGTTAPLAKLGVVGDDTGTSNYTFYFANSNGGKSFYMRNDGQTTLGNANLSFSGGYGISSLSSGAKITMDTGGSNTGNINIDTTVSNGQNKHILLKPGGNVGIGTTAPGALLHVGSGGTLDNVGANDVYIQNDLEVDGTIYGTVSGYSSGTGTAGYMPYWSTSSTLANSALYYDGTNIGIGNTSPTSALFIDIPGGNGSPTLTFGKGASGTSTISFLGSTSGGTEKAFVRLDGNEDLGIEGDTNIIFYTQTSSNERMRIDSAGNVGIGTTAPSKLLNIASTSTSTTFAGFGLDWSPSSATTSTGDLFTINIGANGTAASLFNVTDAGSSLFKVTETSITSALPHVFTAAGDVSFAYDAVFTNQTASTIDSYGPLTIRSGESFENNDLTLTTYGTGDLLFNPQGTGHFQITGADPSVVFNTQTGTDTDYWMGVVEDAGGDDDDLFVVGDGTSPGTNNFLAINTSGNVGIGTTGPSSKFEISGSSPKLTLTDTSSTSVTLSAKWSGAEKAKLVMDTGGSISGFRFFNGPSLAEQFTILSNGHVQIGSSTDQGYGLYVAQSAVRINQSYLYGSGATAYLALYDQGSGNVSLFNTSTNSQYGNIRFGTNSLERVRITTAGNVGVGNTSPGALLVVGSGGTLDNVGADDVYFQNDLEVDGTIYGSLSGYSDGTGTAGYVPYWSGSSTLANSGLYYTGTNVGIGTTAPGALFEVSASPTQYFRVTGSTIDFNVTNSGSTPFVVTANSMQTGNLASLTSSSTTMSSGGLLSLSKTGSSGSTAYTGDISKITYAQTFNGGVGLESTGNVFDLSRAITLNNAGNTHTISGAVGIIQDSGTQTAGTLTSTADVLQILQNYSSNSGATLNITTAGSGFALRVNDDGTLTDTTPFVINASGDVGIGTTSPAQKLDVVGSGLFSGTLALSGASVDSAKRVSTTVTGTSGSEYAIYNTLSQSGSSELYGTYNSFVGTNTGQQYFGTYNFYDMDLQNDAGFGLYNSFDGGGITSGESATSTGVYNTLANFNSSDAATFYGVRNVLGTVSASVFVQYGLNNSATLSTGEGYSYGVYNSFAANGTGEANGIRNLLTSDATGAATLYGLYNSNTISASDVAYGLYAIDGNSTGGTNYGVYVDVDDAESTNYSLYVNAGSGISYFGSNVGIGTTNPGAALQVAGNIYPTTDDTYDLGSNTLRWQDLYLGPASLHIGTSTSDEYVMSYNTTSNTLGFNVNGSGNPEIVFDSSGNIGIGTTAPSSLLDVVGTIKTTGFQLSTGAAQGYYLTAADGNGTFGWTQFAGVEAPTSDAVTRTSIGSASANIALGTTVTEGSGGHYGSDSPDHLTDGNTSTLWQPCGGVFQLSSYSSCYAIIDLGSSQTFNTIAFSIGGYWVNNKPVNVEVSTDGSSYSSWVSSLALPLNTTTTNVGAAVTARYIKISAADNSSSNSDTIQQVYVYKNYLVVTGLETGYSAKLYDSGPTLQYSVAATGSTAYLPLGSVTTGEVRVYDESNNLLATSSQYADLEDGDTFTFSSSAANGTTGYVLKWQTGSKARDSLIYDTGTNIGIGTTAPGTKLEVSGGITATFSTANTAGLCWDNSGASEVTDCSSAPTDIAEMYTAPEGAGPGDLVKINPSTDKVKDVSFTSEAYDNGAIGIISTFPSGTPLGEDSIPQSGNPQPVALSGRVPVKVSLENGEIKAGDALTASSTPGVAMKATSAGRIVGFALEDYDGSTQISSAVREEEALLQADNTVRYWKKPIQDPPQEVGKIMLFVNATYWSPTSGTQVADASQVDSRLSAIELVLANIAGTGGLTQDEIDQMLTDAQTDTSLEGIQSLLDSIENDDVFSNLVVTDTASIESLTATNLTVGQDLFFESATNGINTVAAPLRIQPSAFQPVDIMAGALVIDTSGNAVFSGDVTIQGDLGVQGAIKASESVRGINVDVPQGSQKLEVTFGEAKVSADYAVTVTPAWNTRVWVTQKSEAGFTANFSLAAPDKATIDWVTIE